MQTPAVQSIMLRSEQRLVLESVNTRMGCPEAWQLITEASETLPGSNTTAAISLNASTEIGLHEESTQQQPKMLPARGLDILRFALQLLPIRGWRKGCEAVSVRVAAVALMWHPIGLAWQALSAWSCGRAASCCDMLKIGLPSWTVPCLASCRDAALTCGIGRLGSAAMSMAVFHTAKGLP